MRIETIEQGKIHVQQGLSDGVTCPCCQQHCQKYDRHLYSDPVAALCRLYRLTGGEPGIFKHMRDIGTPKTGGGDFSKLRHWGLISAAPKELHNNPKTKTSGMWALTEKGRLFVDGAILLPRKCMVFNNHNYGFIGDQISVLDALKEDFDYAKETGKLL